MATPSPANSMPMIRTSVPPSPAEHTYPVTDKLAATGSFGYSNRQLVEASGISRELTFRTIQGFGQLSYEIHRSNTEIWNAFAGLSISRNDSYLKGDSVPLIIGGGEDGWLRSGHLRLGINGAGRIGRTAWSADLYGLKASQHQHRKPAQDQTSSVCRLGLPWVHQHHLSPHLGRGITAPPARSSTNAFPRLRLPMTLAPARAPCSVATAGLSSAELSWTFGTTRIAPCSSHHSSEWGIPPNAVTSPLRAPSVPRASCSWLRTTLDCRAGLD